MTVVKPRFSTFGFTLGNITIPYYIGAIPFNIPKVKMARPALCERAVELPLAYAFLQAYMPNILELGGVTPYYFKSDHLVIDIYDKHPRCSHKDILDINNYKGKNVLSISTLEHIQNVQAAYDTICRINAEASHYLITLPIGFNFALDTLIKIKPPIARCTVLYRTTGAVSPTWKIDLANSFAYKYNTPFKYANAIRIFTSEPLETLCNLDYNKRKKGA